MTDNKFSALTEEERKLIGLLQDFHPSILDDQNLAFRGVLNQIVSMVERLIGELAKQPKPGADFAALRFTDKERTPDEWKSEQCVQGGSLLKRGPHGAFHAQPSVQIVPAIDGDFIAATTHPDHGVAALLRAYDARGDEIERLKSAIEACPYADH